MKPVLSPTELRRPDATNIARKRPRVSRGPKAAAVAGLPGDATDAATQAGPPATAAVSDSGVSVMARANPATNRADAGSIATIEKSAN